MKTDRLSAHSHSQKSRPFSCRGKRGHKAPPPFATPAAPTGITHYTLQARLCAKGVRRPLWNPPVLWPRDTDRARDLCPVSTKPKQAASIRLPPQADTRRLFGRLRAGTRDRTPCDESMYNSNYGLTTQSIFDIIYLDRRRNV